MTTTMTKDELQVDWLAAKDLLDCCWIDGQCFEPCHTAESLTDWLRNGKGRHVGIVLRWRRMVQGFLLYHNHDRSVHLERLAVSPNARRQGVATLLLLRMIQKVHAGGRRRCLTCSVEERNLPAQLLLRRLEFLCTGTRPDTERSGDRVLCFRYLALDVE